MVRGSKRKADDAGESYDAKRAKPNALECDEVLSDTDAGDIVHRGEDLSEARLHYLIFCAARSGTSAAEVSDLIDFRKPKLVAAAGMAATEVAVIDGDTEVLHMLMVRCPITTWSAFCTEIGVLASDHERRFFTLDPTEGIPFGPVFLLDMVVTHGAELANAKLAAEAADMTSACSYALSCSEPGGGLGLVREFIALVRRLPLEIGEAVVSLAAWGYAKQTLPPILLKDADFQKELAATRGRLVFSL